MLILLTVSVSAALDVARASPEPAERAQEPTPTTPISQEDIDVAVAMVKSDPNLGAERTMKMLRWRESGQQSKGDSKWLLWFAGFFGWLMQSARYLMWAGVVFLASWLGVYLWRAFRNRPAGAGAADAFVPPTHVRNLDIRPESLPPNIGAAARKLWDRGEHRAALSLLYRGLLSRLTHVHRVPIKDSSTEGDCLSLLAGRVPAKTNEYSSQLVDAWRGFVYGGSEASAPAIHALCDGFSGALDRAVARRSEGGVE
jgi:hypothetical protein